MSKQLKVFPANLGLAGIGIIAIVSMMLLTAPAAFPQVENLTGSNTQVDSDLKFGLELFKNKMYDLAEEQFTKFLQEYPASSSAAQAKYYLAMSQFDQNKFAAAATSFQTFSIQYPNDPLAPTAWMNAGESYAKVGDNANAGLSYERLQAFYPKDIHAASALVNASKYFILSGDTSRAEIALLNVVQDYSTTPDYFDATFQLGNLYFNWGDTLKAEFRYKALLSSDNDSVRVIGLFALGRLSDARELSEQAEKYFEDAEHLKIAPWSNDAILESIEIDIGSGNYSLALHRASGIENADLTADQREKLEFEKVYASLAVGDSAVSKSLSRKLKTLPAGYKMKLASLLKIKRRYADGIALLASLPPNDATDESVSLYAELAFRAGKMGLADSLLSWYIDRSKNPTAESIVKLLDIENLYLSISPIAANAGRNADKARRTFYSYQNVLKDFPDAYLYYKARFEDEDKSYESAMDDYRELLATYPESDYSPDADSSLNYISNYTSIDYKSAVSALADIVSEQAVSSGGSFAALFQLGELFENDLKECGKAVRIYRQLSSVTVGDTERMSDYLLAGALEKAAGGMGDKNSESYSIYERLASDLKNDSIAENSLFHVMRIQCAAGDSVGAENSALGFLKRFPNSEHAQAVYCLLAEILYSSGAYPEAISQAELAGSLSCAKLVLARSEIAVDSFSNAKSTLEGFFNSDPPNRYLFDGQLLYIHLLQKMKTDAEQAYLNFLSMLVPSKYKDKITEQFGDYLFKTGRYDTAYAVYRTIGEEQFWYTDPPSLIYKMAYCKLKSGNDNSAGYLFQRVVTSSEDPVEISDSYNQLGKIYETLGDKRISASFFEKAGSGDIAALVSAGDTYFRMGDYDDAVQVYRKILNETNVDTLKAFSAARLIDIDYKNDKIESADAAAAAFNKNYPGKNNEYLARFLVDKAEYLIKSKKYEEAQKILDQVKSDFDDTSVYPASLLDQARIMVEVGHIDKAQEELIGLVKKFPASTAAPAAHFELGNIYFAKEKFQDAIDNFRTVCTDSTTDPDLLRDAMSRLISSYESAGQYDGALDNARKFIAKYPDDPSVMDMKIKVGVLYEELRYFDQALIVFQNLAKEASRDYQAELHYYVGAIYDDKGDYSNAILEFLRVPYLALPNEVIDWAAQAYYMAGKCYEQLNKPNEAIAMYQKIVDKPHTDPTFVTGAEREINRVKALLK